MGHNHPDKADDSMAYHRGHFIVVAGDCLAHEGTSTMGPGLTLTEVPSLMDHPM
jgi:hypothetical protein